MIKQLLNLVIAKYRDLPVSRRSIVCLRQIIDQLTTDKLRYFAQPHPIIVNYYSTIKSFCHIGQKKRITQAYYTVEYYTVPEEDEKENIARLDEPNFKLLALF